MKYLFIKLLNFINKITKYSICFFILFFIRILRPLILIKFDSSHSSRIGHFSGINSLYISEKINIKAKKQIEFFIHESFICNSHMETLLKRKIFFLPNYFYPILIINNWIRGGNKHLIHYRSNYIDKRVVFEHRDIKNLNDTTSAPVQFSNEEINLAKNEIKKIGINENDKIIILNIRDQNYLKIIYPKNNWNYKTQNSNIQSYKKTVQYLLNKGYKVVRCGLHHQETLNIIDKNFIDLFNIGVRTALIENYLTSICLFQIGSYSGGTIPAQFMFRKPIIYCNFIPINELTVLLFASLLGILWLSTVPLTSGIISVMFGPYYMSMLFGIVFFSHQVGSFLGSWLGGKLFDTYGSYDIMWYACIILGFLSAVVHLPIKEIQVTRLQTKSG